MCTSSWGPFSFLGRKDLHRREEANWCPKCLSKEKQTEAARAHPGLDMKES